jgi:hypothetical protein
VTLRSGKDVGVVVDKNFHAGFSLSDARALVTSHRKRWCRTVHRRMAGYLAETPLPCGCR